MPFLPPYICVSVYITKWGEVSARARADLSRQEAQMHVHGKLILVLCFTKYETQTPKATENRGVHFLSDHCRSKPLWSKLRK